MEGYVGLELGYFIAVGGELLLSLFHFLLQLVVLVFIVVDLHRQSADSQVFFLSDRKLLILLTTEWVQFLGQTIVRLLFISVLKL